MISPCSSRTQPGGGGEIIDEILSGLFEWLMFDWSRVEPSIERYASTCAQRTSSLPGEYTRWLAAASRSCYLFMLDSQGLPALISIPAGALRRCNAKRDCCLQSTISLSSVSSSLVTITKENLFSTERTSMNRTDADRPLIPIASAV